MKKKEVATRNYQQQRGPRSLRGFDAWRDDGKTRREILSAINRLYRDYPLRVHVCVCVYVCVSMCVCTRREGKEMDVRVDVRLCARVRMSESLIQLGSGGIVCPRAHRARRVRTSRPDCVGVCS